MSANFVCAATVAPAVLALPLLNGEVAIELREGGAFWWRTDLFRCLCRR